MGVPFETIFSGSLDFQSNLTKALRRHKSVEIEISKADMMLQLELCRLQQGNLKGATFYKQKKKKTDGRDDTKKSLVYLLFDFISIAVP